MYILYNITPNLMETDHNVMFFNNLSNKIFDENDCPNANYIMENGFYLPSGNTITNEEIDYVCEEIKKISLQKS